MVFSFSGFSVFSCVFFLLSLVNLLVFFLVETTASVTPVERLRGALPVWRELGAPRSILRLIEHGLTVPWQHGPPPSWPILREYPLSPEQRVWWEVEGQRQISLGAIRPAAAHERSHICPAFCVPKDRPGVFRLVRRAAAEPLRAAPRVPDGLPQGLSGVSWCQDRMIFKRIVLIHIVRHVVDEDDDVDG